MIDPSIFPMVMVSLFPVAAPPCQTAIVQIAPVATTAQPSTSNRFTVEIAASEADRERGLMNRASLPKNHGMLFVFDHPQRVWFWMRNTEIPLVMLFITASGVVETVHANAVPEDWAPISGGADIQYVLEIGGGVAKARGIAAGETISLDCVK